MRWDEYRRKRITSCIMATIVFGIIIGIIWNIIAIAFSEALDATDIFLFATCIVLAYIVCWVMIRVNIDKRDIELNKPDEKGNYKY